MINDYYLLITDDRITHQQNKVPDLHGIVRDTIYSAAATQSSLWSALLGHGNNLVVGHLVIAVVSLSIRPFAAVKGPEGGGQVEDS